MITEINKAMQKCFKNGVTVYPVKVLGGWVIEYDVNGIPKQFDKVIQLKEINKSVTKTYLHLANKL
tara:strand:- start:312 stop:509 length:198 start_codon:yes stop_codon:yes gene_type:complete